MINIEILTLIVSIFGSSAMASIISAVVGSQLTKYRLEQLEKKVDKHNNLAERIIKMESRVADTDIAALEARAKSNSHRLDKLEK